MKKVLSMLLTACMLLTLPPVTVLAEGVTSTELSGEITGFDELSTTTMAVPLGTELKDLELPKSLMATVRAAAEVEFDVTEEPVQDADSSNVQTEWRDIADVSLLSVNSSIKSGNSATADHFVIEKDTEATPSSAVDSSTMPADPIDPTSGTNTEVEDNEQPVSDKTPSVDSSTMPVDLIDATSSTATEVKQPVSDKTPVSECEEVTVSIPVTWVSTPEYEKDTAGVYVFTPETEGYTVSADLPEITVTVGEAAPLMMLLRMEDSPEKSITESSLYFKEDSGSQQYSTDNSNWTTYTGEFTIIGSSTSDTALTNTVVVLSGTHDITLSYCSIGAVTTENTSVPGTLSPFDIQRGTVNLTLEGTNKLYSANYHIAGLHVGNDASLFITADSSGSLDAYCHKVTQLWGHGAGIGGNGSEVNGSITIDGGNINANSYHGAGIGGGYQAKNNSITINNGNVTAISGGGCGIGSGNRGGQSGGAVTINGGNINIIGKATTIKNGSGENVYLATFTEPDGNKNKAFNVITPAYDLIGANAIDGKWYVYLPTGTATAIYGSDTCSATVVEAGSAEFTYQSLIKSAVTLMGVTNGTVEASANATGAITSGTTMAVEGERITITPNADNGYELDTVSVYKTGDEATIVPVTDYTFTMPAYPVTIRVTTKKIPTYSVSGTVSPGTTSSDVSGLIVNLYDSMDTAFVTSKVSATTSTGGVYTIPSVFNGSYVARVAGVSGSYAASTAAVKVNGAAVSGTNITLVALTTKSIAVSSHDHKTGYKVGDVLDVSNLKITVTRSDNSTSDKDVTTDMVSGFDSSAVAPSKSLTITLDGKITNYTISVSRAAYSGPGAAASTLGSKTDTQVVLNRVTVAGQTVEYGGSTADNASAANWQSSTTFTGLTAGTTYYFFTRVKQTDTTEAGGVSTALSVTTKTAAAVAPTVTAETLIGTGDSRPTSNSITINTVAGNEYVISASGTEPTTWPTSGDDYFKAAETGLHIFTGLTAATKYYIHVRVAETETAMPSESTYVAQYTPPATIEASVVTINYMDETLSFDNTYEVSTTEGFNTTILNGGALQPGTTYYVRVKAASGVPASEAVSFTTEARPATPDAVTAGNIKKTDTTITITSTVSTQEYSIDGGATWKAGNGSLTFTGLTGNKHYSVVTRIPATDMSFASVSTAARSVTTKTAAAVAPTVTAETLIGTGDSRPTSAGITINTATGNEYVISTSATAPTTWPTSGDDYFKAAETGIHTFNGLTAATKYYIHVRVAETETAMPSASAYAAQYTLPTTIEASVVTINYMEETLSFDNTYEVSTTEGFNTTILNGGALQPGTTYYVRVKAASGVPASEAVSFTTAARPATPDAVTAGNIKKTDTTITITSTVSTQEYSIDGGTTWKAGNGSLTFTGLTANKHYSVVTRIPATDMSFASASTAALSVTTKTAAAVAPTVTPGTLIGTGDSRPTSAGITINTATGNEYVISTSATAPTTWPTSGDDYFKATEAGIHTFTGLTAATKYYIHVRVAETETAMPSASAYAAQYTLPATIEASVVTINYMEETLSFDNAYEVSTTVGFNTTLLNGGALQPGTTYYVRVKAASGVPASETVSFTTAARPATPDAVTVGNIEKTDTTITIESTVSTQEYSIDGGTTWKAGNGSLTFTGLTANKHYSVVTRIPATDISFASVCTAALSVTTKTAAAVAPTVTAETLIGTGDSRPTSDSITINTVAGNEYVISASATEPTTWPTSGDDYFKAAETGIHIFTGLTAATKYYIHVRVAETETAMPSVSASVAQYTLPATIEASVVTINYMEETLSFDNTYEVSTTDNFNITIPDGGLVQPGTTYYVRVKAASGVPASEAVSFTTAARPATPDAVTAGNIKKTDTIITITSTVSTQEYSIDGGTTWKAGNGSLAFTALIANQPYSVLTRIPATGTTFESVSAPLGVTTKMASAALNSSGVTYSVRGGTITGLGNTYEYSMDEGSTWLTTPVTSVTFTEGRVLVRIKETNDAMPSLPQTLGTIAAAAASNALTLESKTYNSVTLTSMKGYEYSRDSGMTWQSSNVFSGLSGGAEYSFMARIEATNIALPGAVSTALSVTTNETPSSGGSGDGSGTSVSSAKPTEPVTGAAENKATIDNQGNASVTVTEKNITDAIASAKAEAVRQGVNAGEITVLINVSTAEENVTNFSVNLPNTAQQQIISNKIAGIELAVDRPDITVGINLAAVMEINRQANQDVKLIVTKTDGSMLSSAAKTIIQSRPVYDFKASYQDGSKHVTNFGSGKVYVSIPYTPVNNEATGCLYMAYVDDNGEVSRVPGSAYDTNSKSLIFTTDHFSVYGVGYTAPTVNFTDIGNHWAKESIDYVAGRGFIGGIGNGTFNPDGAITRGDFITALGRLANVDTNAYTSSSFTDVKDSSSLPYIEWAYSKGIIQGTGNSQFAPDSAITRQETAVILQNYAKATGYQLPAIRNAVSFADAISIDSACKEAVKTMQQAGILMGEQNNRFNPTANTTRAKASAILHRYIKLIIDPSTAQGWTQNDDGQYLYYKAGVMVSGKWLEIDNKWYYFNADGSLAISTIVDGYEIDENGVMKTK